MSEINTVNDWMNHIANAIAEEDHDMLYDCIHRSKDWLQPEEERTAQLNLIEAVKELMIDNDLLQNNAV